MARRKDPLHILAQDLQKKYGIQADILVADLGLVTDLNRVANAIAGDERVTVPVNSAGTASFVPSVAMSLPDLDTQLNVNARAVSYLSLAVLPEFLRRNAGTIINIGSVLSFSALRVSASHSATKAHVLPFPLGMGKRKNGSAAVRRVAAGASPAPAGRSWQREFHYEGWRAFRESLRAARPGAESTVERFLAGSDRRLRCKSRWLR